MCVRSGRYKAHGALYILCAAGRPARAAVSPSHYYRHIFGVSLVCCSGALFRISACKQLSNSHLLLACMTQEVCKVRKIGWPATTFSAGSTSPTREHALHT